MEYDNDQSYQDRMDQRFYKGKEPSELTPFTFEDIASLIAFLTLDATDQDRYRLIGYFFSDYSWFKTCLKCQMSKDKWFRFRKRLLKRYASFLRKHQPKKDSA